MDETTTLAVVGVFVVVVCVGRLLAAMLGGGRGAAGTPRASFQRVRRVRPWAGGAPPGGQAGRKTRRDIGAVGRLGDDEVRRALDDLKGKMSPRRR